MELKDYLTNSRNKRNELLKTAQGYLQTVTSTLKNSPVPDSEDIYSGPNPQGLQLFEGEVTYQLKKIFTPSLNERSQNLGSVFSHNTDQGIRKIYTKNSKRFKKSKQLVIIPKDHRWGYVKIPPRVRKSKNFSLSPEMRNDQRCLPVVQQECESYRTSLKGSLLLPVLSTAGSHEYRSKVYKY